MPRVARVSTKTHYFHTMVQGIEKSFIFDNPIDMNIYQKLIYKYSKLTHVDILAYCILGNHAHLLIHVEDIQNMVNFFRCVNTAYAMYFNRKNKRAGYVFRNRYKSEGIYTVQQLFNTINYIHNNPIKAKLCRNLENYQYSSYYEYLHHSKIINKKILYHFFDKNSFNKVFKISTL